ncbi:MAG TPA: hypothetical protein VNA27_00855 [Rubrobacteraceae bacterium]|nr:hypothetical protein [Rubrobacteraceae bacterium]
MARIAGILARILSGSLTGLAVTSTGSLLNAFSLWAAAFVARVARGVPARRRDKKTGPLRHRVQPFGGIN